jgi:hypothetical protein
MNKETNAKDIFKSIKNLYDELKRKQESGELNNDVELYQLPDKFINVCGSIYEKGEENDQNNSR